MTQASLLGSQSLCQSNKQPHASFDAFIFASSAQRVLHSKTKFFEVEENSSAEVKQKRKRSKACDRCKRFKLKCDVGRPCKNCVSKGCGQQCTDEIVCEENAIFAAARRAMSDMIKPVGFQGRLIELPREPDSLLPQTKNEYLTRLVGGGVLFQMKTARELVESLTPDITDSLIAGIEALQLVQTGHSTVGSLRDHRGRGRSTVQNKHQRGRIIQILDDDYCEDACFVEIGHLQDFTYPPTFSFNRKCAELMGVDAEELLTRAAQSDLSLPCPEVEFLACMIDSLSGIPTGSRNAFTRWQRGYWSGGKQHVEALFVEMRCTHKIQGEELIQESRILPITPEEYEAARRTCPARCRPVLSAMGDTRTASDLLRDVDKDNRQTLRAMRKTPDGRRQLQAMASEIKYRFAPILSAASAIPRPAAPPPSPTYTSSPDAEPPAPLLPSPSWVSSAGSPGTPGTSVGSPSGDAAWGSTGALEPCTSSTSSSSSDWAALAPAALMEGGEEPGEEPPEAQGWGWGGEAGVLEKEVEQGRAGGGGAGWVPVDGLERFGSLTEEEEPAMMGREDSGWMEGFVFHTEGARQPGAGSSKGRVVRLDEEEAEAGARAAWGGAGAQEGEDMAEEGLDGAICFEGTLGSGGWEGGGEAWWARPFDVLRVEGMGLEGSREAWGSMSSEPLGA